MKQTDQVRVIEITINLKTVIRVIAIVILGVAVFCVSILALIVFLFTPSAKPDSNLFFKLRRLQEENTLKFKGLPTTKLKYYNQLLDERLEEIEYIINRGRIDLLWSSSLRYSTTAGRITDLLLGNDLPSEKRYYVDKFRQHRQVLELILKDYYDKYPPGTFATDQWKFIQDGINYLDLYLERLSSSK